jgi:hypothetical protein
MSKHHRNHSGQGTTAQLVEETTLARPDHERIAARAHELYLARGGGDGHADDDWLRAEEELSSESRSSRES